jgi:hypothetical protein
MFFVLYPFVTYLLTLPRIIFLLTLFPAGGVCLLGHVSAYVCHLQVRFSVYSIM